MKYNYPIKYAIMPIYEQSGWNNGINELERKFDVAGYIVSKCYLLSDKLIYLANGIQEREYEVVFPYQEKEYGCSNEWVRTNPKFNNFTNACVNSIIVKNLYESYAEASRKAKTLNKKILFSLLRNTLHSYLSADKSEQIENIYYKRLNSYKILEANIESLTADLIVGYVPRKNQVIGFFDEFEKIMDMDISIYDYIKFYRDESFCILGISRDLFDNVKNHINNPKIYQGEQFLFLTLKDKIKKGLIKYLVVNFPEQKILKFYVFDSEYNVKMYYIDKNNNLFFVKEEFDLDNCILSYISRCSIPNIYTIEPYESIISFYGDNEKIYLSTNNSDSENQILKKIK